MGIQMLVKVTDPSVWEKVSDILLYGEGKEQIHISELTNGRRQYFKFKKYDESKFAHGCENEIIKRLQEDCILLMYESNKQTGVEEYTYYAGDIKRVLSVSDDTEMSAMNFKHKTDEIFFEVFSNKKIELYFKEREHLRKFDIRVEPCLTKMTKSELIEYASRRFINIDERLTVEEMVLCIDPDNLVIHKKLLNELENNQKNAKGKKFEGKKFVLTCLSESETIAAKFYILNESGIITDQLTDDTNYCVFASYDDYDNGTTEIMKKVKEMTEKDEPINLYPMSMLRDQDRYHKIRWSRNRTNKIHVDGLDGAITYYMHKTNSLATFDELCEIFGKVSKEEVEKSLDHLCNMGILLQFEGPFGPTYSFLFDK